MAWQKFIPKKIRKAISTHRTIQRSWQRNERMKIEHGADLPEKCLRNLRVLANREAMLKEMPQHAVCAEVGVAEADFTVNILRHMKPEKLFLIDLWSSDSDRYAGGFTRVQERVAESINSGIIKILRGYSWDMLASLEPQSLDWVYIDAAHDYESVRKDLAAVLPKMKPTGWICGHDYTRWSSAGIHRWGVVEAVNEFCVQHAWEFCFLTHETHRHISYAIRKLEN